MLIELTKILDVSLSPFSSAKFCFIYLNFYHMHTFPDLHCLFDNSPFFHQEISSLSLASVIKSSYAQRFRSLNFYPFTVNTIRTLILIICLLYLLLLPVLLLSYPRNPCLDQCHVSFSLFFLQNFYSFRPYIEVFGHSELTFEYVIR